MTIEQQLFIKNYLQAAFPAGDLPDIIIKEARRWIGTPFRHAGRSETGIDCVGIPIKILHFLRYTEWDDIDYSRRVNPARMKEEIELFCVNVEQGIVNAQKADLLWFNICGSSQHVGIYTGKEENTLIHAYESVGKVVEHELNNKWVNRIQSVYRFIGIE